LIAGVIAVCSAPSEIRADGKKKTGGLFGGVWDEIVVGFKMMVCPYCKAKIFRDVKKCQHCGEWVVDGSLKELSQM
jgi:hypothetical protein